MRGLLSAGPASAGLLQLDPRLLQALSTRQPQRADADDERMFAQSGNGYTEDGRALSGLLSATPQQAQRQQAAPQAPARTERGRANAWRVLDGVLGGRTISESIDGERARQQRLADEPAERERLARLSSLAQGMGPMAELAFATNRDEFGKAMASNLEGYTLSAGGVRGGALGPVAAAPTTSVVNDQIFRNDPMAGTSTAIARADPSHANLTARINATNPVSLAPGARLVDPYTGEERAQGAARVFSAADGAQLYDEQGTKIAENEKDPAGPTREQSEATERASSTRREVLPTLATMGQLLDSGQVITGFGAEARLTAERARAAAGDRDAQERVSATERYRNLSGQLRVGMAKSLGANPSDADLKLLKEITAGDIGQSAQSLRQSVLTAEARANALINEVGGPQPQATGGLSRDALIAEARRRGLPID